MGLVCLFRSSILGSTAIIVVLPLATSEPAESKSREDPLAQWVGRCARGVIFAPAKTTLDVVLQPCRIPRCKCIELSVLILEPFN